VYSCDWKTETLKVVPTVKKEQGGSMAFRLSRDGNLAAASSFRGCAVLHDRRDLDTGLLSSADIVSPEEPVDAPAGDP